MAPHSHGRASKTRYVPKPPCLTDKKTFFLRWRTKVEKKPSPFLPHALGTLIGAFVAAKLAANHHMKFAMGIGVSFLIGGLRWPSIAVVPRGSSHPTFCWPTFQWPSLEDSLPPVKGLKLHNKALNLTRCCRAEFLTEAKKGKKVSGFFKQGHRAGPPPAAAFA